MQTQEIIKAIESFDKKHILIIGDVMIDSYLRGDVERISPEAPIPVVSIKNREDRLGGAANVAININALSAKPILCSVIGIDDNCKTFFDLLEKENINNSGIIQATGRKTTLKTRIISNNQHLLRVDDEQDNPISIDLQNNLIEKIISICKETSIDAIIFEDYDKGVITPVIIKEITNYANKKGIITTVDPKKKNFSYYKNISLLKPNYKEFCEGIMCEVDKNDTQQMTDIARKYMQNNNIKNMLITLSENGVLAIDTENSYHIMGERRDIADVSGAGDTVISTLTLCMAAGMPLREIAIISNLAGGLVCERSGVVPININELISEI
ncbi:MAG TPA: bifunctional ADP-heptose synthase [Bacteroidales bacterium]|jgi:rfaE bifunctional protein kinase chain/domain|nr:bifunctional ADP-heptose synthase [Bacteroidales bacterium]MDD4236515.1 bifunctional ADP-heptose synthase [Bacteroidales bacterium]HRW21564.1 bifunctional ADP-heptose synthase [Bacteroidales bacterium]HXK81329.1 bifunctional ADP-heptose synthase [Bacteroidales bacterium]